MRDQKSTKAELQRAHDNWIDAFRWAYLRNCTNVGAKPSEAIAIINAAIDARPKKSAPRSAWIASIVDLQGTHRALQAALCIDLPLTPERHRAALESGEPGAGKSTPWQETLAAHTVEYRDDAPTSHADLIDALTGGGS